MPLEYICPQTHWDPADRTISVIKNPTLFLRIGERVTERKGGFSDYVGWVEGDFHSDGGNRDVFIFRAR